MAVRRGVRQIARMAPRTTVLCVVVGLLIGDAGSVGAQSVRWVPEGPVQGSLVRLEVTRGVGDTALLRGTMAGEPLHFMAIGGGRVAVLAAIPMDTRDSIIATLTAGDSASIRVVIPVKRGVYGSEKLTVAPNMARPPDSATVKRIAAENAQALAIAHRAHDTPQLWHAPFVAPRPSRITDNYGRARTYNGIVESRHYGTDYQGQMGDPVKAPNAGVVALVADFYLAGKVLYIDHGAGLVTGYFHLSEALVSRGDTVKTGQIIGKVGKSGRVTGPHLHWSVRYGATSVDPASLLRLEGAPPTGGSASRGTPPPLSPPRC